MAVVQGERRFAVSRALHLTGLLERFAGHGLDAVAQRQAGRTLDAVERAL